MGAVYILGISIFIQVVAVYLALRLIPVTGKRRAWILISTAIFLMAVRRCITLYQYFGIALATGQAPKAGTEEWTSLITSVLMLAGIALISPLFHTIQRSAQALKESEEKYRTLFEQSRDAIYVTDGHGKLVDVNQATLDLFGYSHEQMIGMDVRALYVDSEERGGLRDELLNRGYTRDFEMRLRRIDGPEMHCLLSITVHKNTDGTIRSYHGTVRDITLRRQMHESLKEHNRILNATLAASPVGISLIRDQVFDWVNDSMCRMLGYEVDSLKGSGCLIVYPDAEEYERVLGVLRTGMESTGLGRADARLIRRDGAVINCHLQATSLGSESSCRELILAAMDISDLKRAEEALRESEERYRCFFEEDLTGVYISTPEGCIVACNPAFAHIFGFGSVEEAMKCDIHRLYPDSEERSGFLQLLKTHKRLEYHQRELRTCDGKLVHVIENAMGTFDEQGELVEIKGYVFDNTKLKDLEAQLLHSQKMEAIGRLAGGVAHDFNNLLTAITGYTDLILMKLPSEDPVHRKAEEIKKAAERAASLTRQLLAFSRKQVLEPKVILLNTVIYEMEKMLRRLIGEDIELVALLEENIGYVKTDPGQIEQVIMNLAVNARDAMPNGGKLTIETANVDLDDAYARVHVSVQPGAYVMLAVNDTGIGMDQETLTHVFEPFFTTKDKDKGTGLGLATVYGIVRQSGGHIWVYSEPGKGTSFKIYLPRVEQDDSSGGNGGEIEAAPRGWETILLVEDDDMVRSIISESLRLSGYTVLEARHGEEASEMCQSYDGTIHIMVTDVVMPGINGRELAEQLIMSRPEMKILFISGYTDKGIVHNGVLEPGMAFLQKPFRLDALSHKIRQVLEQ